MPSPPAHEKTSVYLNFRCTVSPEDLKYKDFFVSLFSDFICAYELGEKNETPHFHCLFKKQGITSAKFTKMVKDKFNLHGNEQFSVANVIPTEQDYKQSLEYVCKFSKTDRITPPRILWASPQYTPEIISCSHEAYHVRHNTPFPATHVSGVQQISKTVKIKARTWTEKVQEWIDDYSIEQKMEWNFHDDNHLDLMLDIVLKKLGESSKKINAGIVKDIVLGFFNHVDAKGFRKDMKSEVFYLLNRSRVWG